MFVTFSALIADILILMQRAMKAHRQKPQSLNQHLKEDTLHFVANKANSENVNFVVIDDDRFFFA
jgi:hypothetical protein